MRESLFQILWRQIGGIGREHEKYLDTIKADKHNRPVDDANLQKAKVDQLRQVAVELGLQAEEIREGFLSSLWPTAFTARAEFDGATVVLNYGTMTGARLVATGLPMKMTLRTESGFFISSPIRERLDLFWKEPAVAGEVLVGDLAFDNVISVRGNATLCRALLNAGLRQAATLVIGARDGVMEQRKLAISSGAFDSGRVLKEWAEPFVRMVRGMMARAGRGTEACLAENAVVERIWEVRAFNLAELARHFTGSPAAVEAARTALKLDMHPWCRTLAAANLGMEGAPILEETLANRPLDAGLRATALYHLGRILPAERIEPVLLTHLASKEWPIPSAAVQALAEGVGTVGAVPILLDLAENGWRRSVRHEAAKAAARIQARLEGAEVGQLSVADVGEDEGRLSRTGGERS